MSKVLSFGSALANGFDEISFYKAATQPGMGCLNQYWVECKTYGTRYQVDGYGTPIDNSLPENYTVKNVFNEKAMDDLLEDALSLLKQSKEMKPLLIQQKKLS